MKMKEIGWTYYFVFKKITSLPMEILHTIILTGSARKRNRKEVLANYNKTRLT
jgi:hypothetical protein